MWKMNFKKAQSKQMKFIRKKYSPLLYILSTVLIIYFSFYFFMITTYDEWGKSGSLGDTFGILNALFTSIGTAGIVYTLYLQNKTFEVGIRPLLSFEPKGEEDEVYKIIVTNLGNGTAINIEVFPTEVEVEERDDIHMRPFQFKLVKDVKFNLRAGDSIDIDMGVYDRNNEEIDPIFLALLEQNYSDITVQFKVRYQDVDFKEFYQIFELGFSDRKITMTDL